jgi:uncharacterized protein DUF1298
MAVNCAILSYNGTVYFGFSGDVHAAPDLGRLETFLEQSFAELREAASGKLPQTKKKKEPRAKANGVSALAPTPTATVARPIPPRDPLAAVKSAEAAGPIKEEEEDEETLLAGAHA